MIRLARFETLHDRANLGEGTTIDEQHQVD